MKKALYLLSVAAFAVGLTVSCTDSTGGGNEPVSAPTGLAATDITTISATLKWQHPDADKHEVRVAGGEMNETKSTTGSTLSLEGLTPETEYTWEVRSAIGDVWSEWAKGQPFTTKAIEIQPIPAPTGLKATDITYHSATGMCSASLSWQHSDADKHEVVIDNGEPITVTESGNENGQYIYEATDLELKTYTWKVRSFKGDVWSEWAEGPKFTTIAAPAPFDFRSNYKTVNSARLMWRHPNGTNVDKHEMMIDGKVFTITEYFPEPVGQDVIYWYYHETEELTPGTHYTWKVRSSQNGVWSEWVDGLEFDTWSTDVLPKESDFVAVEGGTFGMGNNEEYATPQEQPVHDVTLSGFNISKYEVTLAQWIAITGQDPRALWTPEFDHRLAVEGIPYEAIDGFIEKLNAVTGLTFSLPTEAQWEFAARGGNESKGYKYSGSDNIDDVAWYYGNSAEGYKVVGQKKPNELGIYDMSGNVMEWCSDWYGAYSNSPQTDPAGPSSGDRHVLRGGNWSYCPQNYVEKAAETCRSTYRFEQDQPGNGGLRLILIR